MGIHSVKSNTSASMLEDVQDIEFKFDNFHEGALAIVSESEENFNALMKAVSVEELAHYEETGTELAYTEASGSGFVARIKEFLMNLWAKIKGLFKKFFAMFDSFVKTDKEFVTKWKKEIYEANGKLKDFKYKGFKFSIRGNDDINAVATKVGLTKSNFSMEQAKKDRENFSDIEEKMRGDAVGESPMTAAEYSKALYEKFRSGESEKREIQLTDINGIVTELMGAADAKKTAEKAMRDLEKIINDQIRMYEKHESENIKKLPGNNEDNKASDAVTVASYNIQLTKAGLAVVQTYNGALLTALKDRSRQNKAVCVSLVHYSPKKESTDLENFGESTSFMSGVVFK